ncbi:ABC transporter permease [Egibacter rhizosphaerae]|uniref:ABC transporter permease n=1 Tax=Egibacter rhizosphaerae TaxID=1670831 RepID=A0A411YFD9_9ACTN|nr:ABC transporter permease [Egibacter rhizosphaerae]QBI19963.1 ABC transporter permease [Egibacter rhizosphaerae]
MTAQVVWTELKLLTREPLTLLVSLLFPVVLMVLLVGSFGNDPDPDFGGVGGTDFYVPVYTAATVAVMGLLGIPTHLAMYRQTGVLRRFRASGLSPLVVMAAQLIVMAALVAVGVAAMVAIGFAGYDLTAPASVPGVALGFVAGTLAFAAIGLLLGSVLPTARAAQGLGLLLFFGLFFVAGGGPPPALLPEAVNRLVELTPMGPLVDAISAPWHGHGVDGVALAALAALAVVAGALAERRLRRE